MDKKAFTPLETEHPMAYHRNKDQNNLTNAEHDSHKFLTGFTLIELLVYVAIFTVAAGMMVGILITVLKVGQKESASTEVTTQLNFVMQTINRLVRDSSNIEIANNNPVSTLKLRMKDSSKDPTCVYLSGKTIKIAEGPDSLNPQNCTSSANDLTNSKVYVDNLQFTKFSQYPGHDTVSVNMQLSYNTQNPNSQFSKILETAIARVSAATFDSDVVPGNSYTYNLGQNGSPWQYIYMKPGTAASPSYTFTSNPTLGIYSPAADILGFSTQGIERARIDSNGVMSVGTTTSLYSSFPSVSLFNNGDFITKGPIIDARAFGAAGDNYNNDTSALQAAINYASSQTRSNIGGKVTVYIPVGKYYINQQLVVPKNVNIFCDGVINANLADPYQAAIWFKSESQLSKIKVLGNGGSGILIGESGLNAQIDIGSILLTGIGTNYDAIKGPQFGVQFNGYNFNFKDIETDGGNIGIYFNGASDIRGHSAITVQSSTGIAFASSEHAYLDSVDIDSHTWTGLRIDTSNEISVKGSIWVNSSLAGVNPTYGALLGEYSSGNPNNGINLDINFMNSGPNGLKISNTKDAKINALMSNAALGTGNSDPITTAIVYGSGLNGNIDIRGAIDSTINPIYSGTLFGTLDIATNANASLMTSGNFGVGTTTPNAKLQIVGGDAAISTQGNGLILRATNGTSCYRLTINNVGTLATSSVTCP